MQDVLIEAAGQTFCQPQVWLIVLAASIYGVFVGSIPGLTATMAVALFVPMTYWLEPMPALAAIVSMSACAIFAGDIPTTLVRIPGTPASAAYVDHAYRLSRQGLASRVLGTSLWASVVGGLFGAVILIILGEWLSRIAMMFSVSEYFWLYVLGLSCPIIVSYDSRLRALFALLIGLLISTIGLGAVHSSARFTFGLPQLYQGIGFIPAMIGLFGLSEVLNSLARSLGPTETKSRKSSSAASESLWSMIFVRSWREMLFPAMRSMSQRKWSMLRSGIVGSGIGILPGAGSDIAAWVSAAMSKKADDVPVSGGDREALDDSGLNLIQDAALSNSASIPASWIPSLVLGIPGDSVTAIVIGVLMMKNIEPGPAIFEKQAALVYSIYMLFILSNLVLLPVGLLAIRLGGYIVHIPRNILLPLILMFCLVGAYSINSSIFDVWIMLAMGILGFILDRRRVPLGPVVLGIILGGPLEERFIQTISGANGSLFALVERPTAMTLALLSAGIWSWTAYSCFCRWNIEDQTRSDETPHEDS